MKYILHAPIKSAILTYVKLCADMVFAATPPYDGTLARYYRIPADLAYELPETLSLEDGAMVIYILLRNGSANLAID
jgi:hypothetical protein